MGVAIREKARRASCDMSMMYLQMKEGRRDTRMRRRFGRGFCCTCDSIFLLVEEYRSEVGRLENRW